MTRFKAFWTDPNRNAHINAHLRKTFVAGMFAAAPLGITIFLIWWINARTSDLLRLNVPFVGMIVAVAAIYLVGLMATGLLGKTLLHVIDSALSHVPVLNQIYSGWKQVALTPGGTGGMFSKVAIIGDETGDMKLIGFTNGRRVNHAGQEMICVFVPMAPNPISGRLHLVPVRLVELVEMTPEEAFKMILSTGNYLPPSMPDVTTVIGASAQSPRQPPTGVGGLAPIERRPPTSVGG